MPTVVGDERWRDDDPKCEEQPANHDHCRNLKAGANANPDYAG